MTDKRPRENPGHAAPEAQKSVSGTPVENEPAKKRRRRILSCDACRRLKCRCDLAYDSNTCSRCRNLRIACIKSDDQTPYTTQEPSQQQDLIKSLHQKVLRLESSMQDHQREQTTISPTTTTTTNDHVLVDEIEPADQHVHAAPAEVIRRVACQVTGDFRRSFFTKDDIVSMGMLSAATANNLVKGNSIAPRRDNWDTYLLYLFWVTIANERRDFDNAGFKVNEIVVSRLPRSSTTHNVSQLCRNLLNFEQSTIRDAMLLAEVSLYCTLQKDDCEKPTFANDGYSSKFEVWKQKWGYLLGLMLNLSYRIANVILAKRSLDRIEADALNTASSVSPQTSHGSTAHLQDSSIKSLQDHVYELSFRVTQAFVAIPSSSSGDLPEFHSLCVAYSLLILCQYDDLPPSIPKNELSTALQEVKCRCNESNSYSVAVRFSVERAWEKLRSDAVFGTEVVGQDTQFTTGVNKTGQSFGNGGQVGGDLDFFFNGGYLDLFDIDNFLL
ncbi:Transcriptional activator of proteases prtT [Fusarium austroafricanum]|uniref:Transcriptional activator of proteases prtT n=1 Tax=Fusarium austroafricanum TaxID=2364996 RepID=A0A8H4KHS5_9HYPO|nr:Transcriptional activator of proteases prtT [Fusarium austroafricanum]